MRARRTGSKSTEYSFAVGSLLSKYLGSRWRVDRSPCAARGASSCCRQSLDPCDVKQADALGDERHDLLPGEPSQSSADGFNRQPEEIGDVETRHCQQDKRGLRRVAFPQTNEEPGEFLFSAAAAERHRLVLREVELARGRGMQPLQ